MKKIFISSFLFLSVLIACDKYNKQPSDLNGNYYIHGRVFYVDNISNSGTVSIFSSPTLYIGYAKDSSLNFITSVKGDINGYFVFNNLNTGNYLIFGDTSFSNVKYTLRRYLTLTNSIDTISLFLTPSSKNQNGVIYTVNDPAGTGPINNVTACLFANTTLVNDSCVGSNYSTVSNPAGYASFLNVPATNYTAVFRYKIGNAIFKAQDNLQIKNDSIVRKIITLH